MHVRGVDFSGSAEPGCDIWITEGRLEGNELLVESCRAATEVFGANAREPVLDGLVDMLRAQPGMTVLDFSFGLPAPLLGDHVSSWVETVEWFAEEFADADATAMRDRLKREARELPGDSIELKWMTDEAVRANSPYSFITYYQTLFGIRDVLWPLIESDAVSVPPMQSPGERTVIESYPAGTLRRLETVDEQYKNRTPDGERRRAKILDQLTAERSGGIDVRLLDGIRDNAIGDSGGDALDSIVAAVATARAVDKEFESQHDHDPLEGHIYV